MSKMWFLSRYLLLGVTEMSHWSIEERDTLIATEKCVDFSKCIGGLTIVERISASSQQWEVEKTTFIMLAFDLTIPSV